ncbi:MAG: S8 family serine peptidase [Bacteroidota bacterium]
MKKLFLILIITLVFNTAFSQKSVYKYRVSFKDKINSPFSVSNPSAFLSQKAITRRSNQGIAINLLDIPVNQCYIDSVVAFGASFINKSKWFNSIIVSLTDTNILQQINALTFVKNTELVITVTSKKKKNKLNDEIINKATSVYFKPQYYQNYYTANEQHLDNEKEAFAIQSLDYGQAYLQINMLEGCFLHNQGYLGQGMTIAILDAGFEQVDVIHAFDSLWLNGQLLGSRDFVLPGNNVFNEASHGMMVLSTMGANIPGQIIGTAPKASYWLIRTEDATSENPIEEDNWTSGAEFADSVGVDVINSSLGYTNYDNQSMSHTYKDLNGKTARASIAATIAARKGIVVVNSVGNSGGSAWKYIGVPSDADSIISVGAVDMNSNYASFSSIGPTYDGRVKPTVATLGQGAVFATAAGVGTGNGTSFSSPIMCGMVACLWQAFPLKNNQEIIEAIKHSASQYNTPDSLKGYGIPNFQIASILLSGTNIHNFDNENTFNAFPNPFDDVLYLAYNSTDTQSVQIEIYDLSGKRILAINDIPRHQGYNSITINNLFILKRGIYIIRVTSGNKTSTQKVLKK